MTGRALNLAVIVTSLLGRLEWGADHREFLAQAELTVLGSLVRDPMSALHPFTVLPMLGQLLLLVSLAKEPPGRVLSLTGIALVAVLLVFLAFIGVVSARLGVVGSTVPFLGCAAVATRWHWRRRA